MSNATVVAGGRKGEVGSWARTTPGRLRLTSALVVLVAVAAGGVAALTMLSRSHAASTARAQAEPLVVEAQALDVELSDANTTLAGGFLAGAVVPAADQNRFAQDLMQASAALTAAAQRAGTAPAISATLRSLTSELASYSAIVATAEANNRQGFPVATAYLGEANNLMNGQMLTLTAQLYATEQRRLNVDDRSATPLWETVAVVALCVVALAALLWLQLWMTRRFRRVLNAGCALATVLALGLSLWLVVAVLAESSAVTRAEHHGSDPLAVLTRARILVSQARADDELTLVTRDSDPSFQTDYTKVAAQITGIFAAPAPATWTGPERQAEEQASTMWGVYVKAHNRVRSDDQAEQLDSVISVDQSQAAPAAAATQSALSAGVADAVSGFAGSAAAARSDLDLLPWAGLIFLVGVGIGVLFGVEPRLREYR